MNNDFEEVIQNTRVAPSGEAIITYNDKKIAEPNLFLLIVIFLLYLIFLLLPATNNRY
jgi:hypothetical protein